MARCTRALSGAASPRASCGPAVGHKVLCCLCSSHCPACSLLPGAALRAVRPRFENWGPQRKALGPQFLLHCHVSQSLNRWSTDVSKLFKIPKRDPVISRKQGQTQRPPARLGAGAWAQRGRGSRTPGGSPSASPLKVPFPESQACQPPNPSGAALALSLCGCS